MPKESGLGKSQEDIELVGSDSLSAKEYYNVQNLKTTLTIDSSQNIIDSVRISVVFLGMCLIFYSVLLFLALLFDRVNQFVEINLVGILTFGKLQFTEDEFAKGSDGLINSKRMYKVLVVLLVIGLLLVSGSLFTYVSRVSLLLNDLVGG